jgi:hypothetical protein
LCWVSLIGFASLSTIDFNDDDDDDDDDDDSFNHSFEIAVWVYW